MIVTVHQPEHMPWLGFFHKMMQADSYVLLDTVQFERGNWQNRNRFLDRQGSVFFLTVPFRRKGYLNSTLQQIEIDYTHDWVRKYLGRITDAYCRHKYFEMYRDQFFRLFLEKPRLLKELNRSLIDVFRAILRISTPLIWASELQARGAKSELLAEICREVGGKTYLSGPSGRDYLELRSFECRDILVEYHAFVHPSYSAAPFQPGLSTFDLVMNCGPESRTVLGDLLPNHHAEKN